MVNVNANVKGFFAKKNLSTSVTINNNKSEWDATKMHGGDILRIHVCKYIQGFSLRICVVSYHILSCKLLLRRDANLLHFPLNGNEEASSTALDWKQHIEVRDTWLDLTSWHPQIWMNFGKTPNGLRPPVSDNYVALFREIIVFCEISWPNYCL